MQPIQFPFDLILSTQTNDGNRQIDHDTATYTSNPFQTRPACVPWSSILLLSKIFLKPGHFSSFAFSEFPRACKKSVIVPHLKDGDHEVPNNNRPISLLPVLSKRAEKIALIQFNDFLTKQDKLTQHQSGNCKNHSTITLSLLVTGHIFRAIDQQQLAAMVLNYRPQQGLRKYLSQYTSFQTMQPRHIKSGSSIVRELPHGPQAVYSIRHLSI